MARGQAGVAGGIARRRPEPFLPYLLLLPAFLLLVGMLYPFCLGLYYSLTSYYLQYPHLFRFVWLGNYAALLKEPVFVYSVEFTVAYALVAVVIQVGLGLGLAICQSIVEAHAGTIEAEANAHGGTTFVVTLPACPVPPEKPESAPAAHRQPRPYAEQGRLVCIVDDDPGVREALTRLLEACGCAAVATMPSAATHSTCDTVTPFTTAGRTSVR